MAKRLDTSPYKGTRDFYPEEYALLRYIFQTWSETAELFGFERYDASLLEPSMLYKSKGAENTELVNEQTYTFTDRGGREVTLRPELTPSAARMVAKKRRDLKFPVKWYAIPNLFRYERMQRGRLREHWQLNCDIFGSSDLSTEIEILLLAHHILTAFGAKEHMFEIRINDRALIEKCFEKASFTAEQKKAMLLLLDKKNKITTFESDMLEIAGAPFTIPDTVPQDTRLARVISSLNEMGVKNVIYDSSIVRGFNYYTGIVFEIFDTSSDNPRSLMGGGRYDNLTELFDTESVTGIGFGMGDVIMKDFLITHGLVPESLRWTSPIRILSVDSGCNLDALKIAEVLRSKRIPSSLDTSDRSLKKKIANATQSGAEKIIVIGENEVRSGIYTINDLNSSTDTRGDIDTIVKHLRI